MLGYSHLARVQGAAGPIESFERSFEREC